MLLFETLLAYYENTYLTPRRIVSLSSLLSWPAHRKTERSPASCEHIQYCRAWDSNSIARLLQESFHTKLAINLPSIWWSSCHACEIWITDHTSRQEKAAKSWSWCKALLHFYVLQSCIQLLQRNSKLNSMRLLERCDWQLCRWQDRCFL